MTLTAAPQDAPIPAGRTRYEHTADLVRWILLVPTLVGWVGLLLFAERVGIEATVVSVVAYLGALGLVIAGPQPWRATRWAWFWVILLPFGTAAFLLLSGPTALVPRPRVGARRLTGGWAFLLLLLCGGGAGAGL